MCDGELRYWRGNLHSTQRPGLELGILENSRAHVIARPQESYLKTVGKSSCTAWTATITRRSQNAVVNRCYMHLYLQVDMNARVTDVHRILARGSEVCKKNVAFLDADGCYLIPESGNAAHRIRKAVKRIREEETEEKPTTLRVEKGVYLRA